MIPEVKEFIDLVTEKQRLSEIEAMTDELVPFPPPPQPPPLLGIRNPNQEEVKAGEERMAEEGDSQGT